MEKAPTTKECDLPSGNLEDYKCGLLYSYRVKWYNVDDD